MKKAPLKTAQLVDQLGALKARIAALTQDEASLKAQLRELGVREAEGELFRATVVTAETETRDEAFKALIEQLVARHTSAQYRAAHTKRGEKVSVRVVARTRKEAA